jgi:hypothetical protein
MPEPGNAFYWTYQGINHTGNQDTAYISSHGSYFLFGGNGTSFISHTERVQFTLTSFATGSYTISTGAGNSVEYIDGSGFIYNGISGTLQITSNTGTTLSGTFQVTLNGPVGSTNTLTGAFTGMPIRP